MAKPKSEEYKKGYKDGFNVGYSRCRGDLERWGRKAYWILKKDGWYCSNCGTKNQQRYDDYCCKCGHRMCEEAKFENN